MNAARDLERCDPRPFHKENRMWKGDENKFCRERFISAAKDYDVSYQTVLDKISSQYGCISIDPDTLGGTPRISNTRIPVYMILDAIEHYGNLEGALKSYPHLTLSQVKDALSFAAEILEFPVEHRP